MTNLLLIAKNDIKESFRSKWFILYVLIFVALIGFFFSTGVVNSRVAGFSGLSRMLLLFIQICIIILPIFILITTVRSVNFEREMGALEYILSFPVSLKEYFFGKLLGRAFVVFVPIILSLFLAIFLALLKGASIAISTLCVMSLLLFSLAFVFLAFGFLISALIKNSEFALGVAFLLWVFLLGFLDITMIGFLMKTNLSEMLIYAVSLGNPLQIFRVASFAIFDSNLAIIAPAAHFILEIFSPFSLVLFAILYPLFLAILCLFLGFLAFSKKDLV